VSSGLDNKKGISKSEIEKPSENAESELQMAIRLRHEKLHRNDMKIRKQETNAWDDD
jgi:hypothetical protein